MKADLIKFRFANAYRFIRLQQRVELNLAFDGDSSLDYLLKIQDKQPWEASDQNAAQRVFESRIPNCLSGSIIIRLAQHKLVKDLATAGHPVDLNARNRLTSLP